MSTQDNLHTTDQMPSAMALLHMIRGFWTTQLIYAAAKLGIADLLAEGPKSSDELAKSVRAHSQALYRVLRALASLGIFAEMGDGRFALTPLAAPLQRRAPDSVWAWAVGVGEEWSREPWKEILYSVKTGKPAFEHIFGMGCFDYFTQKPEAGEIFNEAMSQFTEQILSAVLAAYDFSKITSIADVGGGHGKFIAAILRTHVKLRGVLFDLPSVIGEARRLIEAEGIADRCELVAGDFFQSVPSGSDAYILKFIIHDWDENRSVAILQNCRRAIAANGRLLLVERVIPPGNEPSPGKLTDINMLVAAGGLERTEAEYQMLLSTAGFKLTKIIPTQSPVSLIEGVPV